MLIPATAMKTEIEQAFARIAYTEKRMFYDGCIEDYYFQIKEEQDQFQFAVVSPKSYENDWYLIGYVTFRVNFYDSCAFNFGLIRFVDNDFIDKYTNRRINVKKIMAGAILEIIRMIDSFNVHRIDFRCVGGNPARKKYASIVFSNYIFKKYDSTVILLRDTFKDKTGKYRHTYIYELIRKEYGYEKDDTERRSIDSVKSGTAFDAI